MAVTRDDQLLCVTEYSRIVPLENGEVSGFGRQSEEGDRGLCHCISRETVQIKVGSSALEEIEKESHQRQNELG